MKKIDETFKGLGFSYDKDLLEEEYVKAMKDIDFKNMVESIDVDRSVVVKRTSALLDCVSEVKNCKKCKHILDCKNKIKGYCYKPMVYDNELVFNYEACKYQMEMQDNNKYKDNIYLFDIPAEIKEAKMADIFLDDKKRIPLLKWMKDFLDSYDSIKGLKGLYLSGSFGAGKTYLIAAMFNELAKRGKKSAIIYFPEFLRDLKASFSGDFEAKYDYIKEVPLLLIDDIGAENLTAWGRDEILGTILQYRMQEHKTTFFSSNLNIKELEQHFSSTKNGADEVKARRIIERVKQLTTELELVGKNLRK
ncbi:MAG: primosomal protein DnaI [Bacilli bacterium]|nr:primosomal protein DnaI [Bacilli bacterium]